VGVVVSRSARSITTVASSPAPSVTATVPNTPAPSPAATEAVTALKSLRSVLSAGVTYGNYIERVGEMKIHVDRYLDGATDAVQIRRVGWFN
jgi:hypothetical protein